MCVCVVGLCVFVGCDSERGCPLGVPSVWVPACVFVCGLVGCVSARVCECVRLSGEEPEEKCLWDVGVWELTVEDLWVVL